MKIHSMTVWRPTGADFFPLLVVFLLPVAAALPVLTGWLTSDPMLYVGGLADHIVPGPVKGTPYIDHNAGFQTQALGRLAALEWLRGNVPWWNAYSGVGLPLAAEYQPAAFFPLTLLLALPGGFAWHHLILQLIAGAGTYGLLRQLGLGRLASTTGALLYAFNGTLAWFAHGPASPVAFLPWMLWGIERAGAKASLGLRGGWRMLCASLALMLLAGFPETAYFGGLLALAWAIQRGMQLPSSARAGYAARIAGGGVLGLCLAATQWLSFFAFVPDSYVGPHFDTAKMNASFGSDMIVPHLIAPYAYGSIFGYAADNIILWTIWGGIGGYVTLPLAVLAAYGVAARRTPGDILLAAWIGASLMRAFGVEPVASLLGLIPGVTEGVFYRYAVPSWTLALVILAAGGVHELRQVRAAQRAALGIAGAVAICGIASALYFVHRLWPQLADTIGHRNWAWGSIAWVLLTALACVATIALARTARAAAVVSAVLVVDAFVMFTIPVFANPRAGSVDVSAVQFLRERIGLQRFYTLGPIPPNYGAYFEIASINHNYLPVSRRWVDWIRRRVDGNADAVVFNGGDVPPPAEMQRRVAAFQEAGVKYLIAPPGVNPFAGIDPSPLRDGRAAPTYSDRVMAIFELAAPAPYFETEAACDVKPRDRLLVMVDCPQATRLVRRELFDDGWSAKINGSESPLRPHGEIFQALDVPAGRSEVRYRYSPPYAGWAWLLAALGVAGCLSTMVGARLHSKSHRMAPSVHLKNTAT